MDSFCVDSLGYIPRNEIAVSNSNLCLTFHETIKLFLKAAMPFYIPTRSV
jgi:hypothetical protein